MFASIKKVLLPYIEKIKDNTKKWSRKNSDTQNNSKDSLSTNLRKAYPQKTQSHLRTTKRLAPPKPPDSFKNNHHTTNMYQPSSRASTTINLNLKKPETPVSLTKSNSSGWIVGVIVLTAFLLTLANQDWKLPEKEEELTYRFHLVQKGETLWNVSCFYYGSPKYWKEIFLANQSELKVEGVLVEGMKLIIPFLPNQNEVQEASNK